MKTNSLIRENLKWILPILLLTALVFSNSLNGEFVYDDKRQILGNPLIQNPDNFSRALMSDVWAFKGDGTIIASNYWRPTFTAWSILNYLIFGQDASGWHFSNIFLHLLVCLLCFVFLTRLGAEPPLAFAISLIFAVHPVHTESVAWIAGSPDLLFSLFFLLSIIFTLRFNESGKSTDLWAAVAAFLPALGAKEIALVSIPLFYLVLTAGTQKKKSVLSSFTPFAAAGALYFLLRWIVLGRISEPAPEAAGPFSIVFTAPSLFLFYIKQTVAPFWLGPNYPIRAIETFSISFLIALVIALLVFVTLFLFAKRSRIQAIGFALFLLPLLSAFNVTAFIPEQVAHDRYLYIPVLGFAMIFVPELFKILKKLTPEHSTGAGVATVVLISVIFGIQAYTYNEVWKSDLALWRHSVSIDADSAFNYSQLGSTLEENGLRDESLEAYNRSLDIKPSPLAYLGRARNFIAKGKFEEAIFDLKTIAEMPPSDVDAYSLYQTYEGLMLAYNGKKQPEKAVETANEARKRLPIYRAAFTANLAVVLYQDGKKEEALRELESARGQAVKEMLPESKSVLFRLGMLYSELGRKDEARRALEEYMVLTTATGDKNALVMRQQAANAIPKLR